MATEWSTMVNMREISGDAGLAELLIVTAPPQLLQRTTVLMNSVRNITWWLGVDPVAPVGL